MKAHAALIRRMAEKCATTYECANGAFKKLRDEGLTGPFQGKRKNYHAVIAKARAVIRNTSGAVLLVAPLERGTTTYPAGFIVPDQWLPVHRRSASKVFPFVVSDRGAVIEPAPAPPRPPAPEPTPPSPKLMPKPAPDAESRLADAVKIMLWSIRKIGSVASAREAFERAVVAVTPKKEAVGG